MPRCTGELTLLRVVGPGGSERVSINVFSFTAVVSQIAIDAGSHEFISVVYSSCNRNISCCTPNCPRNEGNIATVLPRGPNVPVTAISMLSKEPVQDRSEYMLHGNLSAQRSKRHTHIAAQDFKRLLLHT